MPVDPPGVGMMLDPVYFNPEKPVTGVKGWRWYFNVVGRYAWITYFAPAEGGATESGYIHPSADDPYPGNEQALLGFHVTRVPFSFHMTYYRTSTPRRISPRSLNWINFSFEYRF